jgi:hypothetical protein
VSDLKTARGAIHQEMRRFEEDWPVIQQFECMLE